MNFIRKFASFLWIVAFVYCIHPLLANSDGYLIKFRIKGLHDTTCMIANYYGNGTYVKDTVKVDATGRFTFNAKENLPKGIYLVVVTDKNYFEFIVNKDKKFSMETELRDLNGKMAIKNSPENSIFYNFIAYRRTIYDTIMTLEKKKEKLKGEKDSIRLINKKIDSLNKININYNLELVKKYPDSFVAFFINAMKEPEIPPAPLLSNGRKDSTFAYRYLKSHFWDGTDFTDDRLLRTPIFHDKLKNYFDNVLIRNPDPDTIAKEIDLLIRKVRPNSEMFEYLVRFTTFYYETSEIMGFDKIFVHIIDTYYVTGQASWTNQTILENLIKKANRLKPLLIGEKAPNMIMLDTNSKPVSMYNLNADYLILFFWDPDCGNCEKEIPKLKEFYDNNKEKYNLEIFAVCSDTSLAKWKQAIIKRGMNWINVDGPRTYTTEFHQLYDISTTPELYILNRKKEIIAKHLRTDQISQFLKNYRQNSIKQ